LTLIVSLLLAAISYGSPVNYPIELAGNFAEPRPNHVHGGCDVKTGQIEGKAIHSIGDGYISRVTVGLSGFGNAVYVHHPEGYTSVYCHLKAFSPRIKAMMRREQYRQKTSNGSFRFRPAEIPVAKGEFIAYSGNTGSSQAPHLHLEIHDNKTWNMHDPLSFIGNNVTDHTEPQAHGFMACPALGEGSFGGGSSNQVFGFGSHELRTHFTAWGKVGFAIWANDYMGATYNFYGIRKTQLLVDGKLAFESDVNNIPVKSNLQVNYWGDYQHYIHSNVWYLRSYLLPGVNLPIFKTNRLRGYVDFNQERDYHLEYIVSDYAGNAAHYKFTVTGRRSPFAKAVSFDPKYTLYWNKKNTYKVSGAQLVVDKHLLAENVAVDPVIGRGRYSNTYRFKVFNYPLLGEAKLAIKITGSGNPKKYYLASNWGTKHYQKSKYSKGWVIGEIRQLGSTYELGYDDVPPTVGPVNQGSWTGNHQITVGVEEAKTGIKSWQGFVDGKFVAFDVVQKSPWVRCNLEETPVRRTGKIHTLKFVALDGCDNKRVYETQFIY
jgi:hypothetical protein